MRKIVATVALLCCIVSAKGQIAGVEMFYNTPGSEAQSNTSTQYKKNCFGLDLGIGAVEDSDGKYMDIGFRYLHNFSPYIGWDVFTLKTLVAIDALNGDDFSEDALLPQLMSGIRAYTPTFAKSMSVFASFKAGYGYIMSMEKGGGCYEFEVGLHLTRTLFLGYAYNFQGASMEVDTYNSKGRVSGSESIKIKNKYSAFRLGFNF